MSTPDLDAIIAVAFVIVVKNQDMIPGWRESGKRGGFGSSDRFLFGMSGSAAAVNDACLVSVSKSYNSSAV
jgi:hypothetical protein